jgi:hypothetical protein
MKVEPQARRYIALFCDAGVPAGVPYGDAFRIMGAFPNIRQRLPNITKSFPNIGKRFPRFGKWFPNIPK